MNKRFSKKGIRVPFVPLEHQLLDSEEWQTLTPKTKEIYIYIRRKFKGDNADEICFTYKEAKGRYKTSQPTLKRAIDDLIKTEIIKLIKQGGKYQHLPSIFSLRGKFGGYYDKSSVSYPF